MSALCFWRRLRHWRQFPRRSYWNLARFVKAVFIGAVTLGVNSKSEDGWAANAIHQCERIPDHLNSSTVFGSPSRRSPKHIIVFYPSIDNSDPAFTHDANNILNSDIQGNGRSDARTKHAGTTRCRLPIGIPETVRNILSIEDSDIPVASDPFCGSSSCIDEHHIHAIGDNPPRAYQLADADGFPDNQRPLYIEQRSFRYTDRLLHIQRLSLAATSRDDPQTYGRDCQNRGNGSKAECGEGDRLARNLLPEGFWLAALIVFVLCGGITGLVMFAVSRWCGWLR